MCDRPRDSLDRQDATESALARIHPTGRGCRQNRLASHIAASTRIVGEPWFGKKPNHNLPSQRGSYYGSNSMPLLLVAVAPVSDASL